jgi:mannan endo-1,4-beta-mannosidase
MRGGARTWFRTVPGRALLGVVPFLLVGGVLAASAGGLTLRSPSQSATGPANTIAGSALASPHLTTTSSGANTSTSSTASSTTSSTTATVGPHAAQNDPAHNKAAVAATSPPTTQAAAPPSTTTTSTDPPTPAGVIGVSNGHLELNEQPYTFVGVNAYEIGTESGVNPGCGGQETDAQLNELFSSLPPNSLVRIWAFQDAIATNVQTDQLDWAPLDRVFAAAAAHGQRLIVTLTDQGGVCDGDHWQDPSWFDGGFMDVFNSPSNSDGSGHTPLSYWDYMQDIVNRYKNSPALGMWEPISEPAAATCDGDYYPGTCWGHTTCPDEAVAAASLRHFFDVVGAEIHSLDPNHLVESGMMGGGECGAVGSDYEYVSASPGIDVLSYHDYYVGAAMGGNQTNGVTSDIAQATTLGKPIIAGEMGLDAGTAPGCMTLATRSAEIEAKIQAQMAAGTSGVLIWDWLPAPSSPCTTDTFPGDPLMAVVAAGPPSA